MDYFFGLIGWAESLPRWQRPVVSGALLVGAFVLVRLGGWVGIPFLLVTTWYNAGADAAAKTALLLPGAVLAGAVAGVAYLLLVPLRLFGKLGVWASWVAASAVYIGIVLGLLNWLIPDPEISLSTSEGRFMLAFCSLFTGSAGFWIFGRADELPPAARHRSTKDILASAVEADLAELERGADTDPFRAQALRQIRGDIPSSAVVMHWWRVVGRIGREGAGWLDLPYRWAQDRAEARLRRAQRRWDAATPLPSGGDA